MLARGGARRRPGLSGPDSAESVRPRERRPQRLPAQAVTDGERLAAARNGNRGAIIESSGPRLGTFQVHPWFSALGRGSDVTEPEGDSGRRAVTVTVLTVSDGRDPSASA